MKIPKISDLRLGNIINFKGRAMVVEEIYHNSVLARNIYDNNDFGTIPEDEISGVQISEDLLGRFGWTKISEKTFKPDFKRIPAPSVEGHLTIEFPYNDNMFRFWLEMKEGCGTAMLLGYVHELQNLYFALHFEDLTFEV